MHHRGVEDLAGHERHLLLEHGDRAVAGHELVADLGRLRDRGRGLAAVEVVAGHVRHVRLRVRAPGGQLVRVLPGERLHRERRPAVGVAFTEDRVHGAAEHLRVARLDRLLGLVLRRLGVVGDVVPLRLQLLDRVLELGDRRRDVRQLDDVGLGRLRQRAELREVVRHPLRLGEVLREGGEDAARERDVPGLHGDAGALRERADDGQERERGERGGLVGPRPHDRRRLGRHEPVSPYESGVRTAPADAGPGRIRQV